MSINLNKKESWAGVVACILTLAQDDQERVHVDYIKNVMSMGGMVLRR